MEEQNNSNPELTLSPQERLEFQQGIKNRVRAVNARGSENVAFESINLPQSYGSSQYDKPGLDSATPFMTEDSEVVLQEQRAQRQPNIAKLGSGIVNGLVGLPLNVAKGFSILGDLEQWGNVLAGKEIEYTNWIADASDKLKESLNLPVYRTKDSQGFSPGSAGWIADLLPDLIETASYFIPGYAITKGLSAAGKSVGAVKLLKALEKASGVKNLAGKASGSLEIASMGLQNRMFEGTVEALDAMKEWKLDNAGKINQKTGQVFTDEELTAEAGEIGSTVFNGNMPLAVLDMLQIKAVMGGFKAFRAMRSDGAKSFAKKLPQAALPESAEEMYQFGLSKEAQYEADIRNKLAPESTFSDRLIDYLKDGDMWTAAFAGALGGGVFAGVGHSLAKREDKIQAKTQGLAENVNRMVEAVIKGDKQAFHKESDKTFIETIIAKRQDGSLDSFRKALVDYSKTENEFLEGAEFKDSDAYKRTQHRIELLDTIDEAFYDIAHDSEVPTELKSAKLSTIIDQRLTGQRIQNTQAELAKLYTDDINNGGLSPSSVEVKKLQTEFFVKTSEPRFAKQNKAPMLPQGEILGKRLAEAKKAAILADPKFEDMEMSEAELLLDKELVSANDAEITKLTKSLLHDKADFEEAKETLRKIGDKKEAGSLIKDIEAKNKIKAEANAKLEAEKAEKLAKAEADAKKKAAENPLASKKDGKVLTTAELEDKKASDFYKEVGDTLIARFPQYDLSDMSESLVDGQFGAVDKNGKTITMDDYNEIIRIGKEIEEKFYPKEVSSDAQTVISEAASGSYPSESEQNTSELEISTSTDKSIGKQAGVVMMSLFHGFKKLVGKNIKFFWTRVKGDILRDNISNLNEAAIKALKVGDKVTYELRTLSEKEKEANTRVIQAIPENKVGLTEGYYESIAILDSNKQLIGFVSLPHEVKINTNYEDASDFDAKKAAREKTIQERLFILNKLKAGETVTATVKTKGTGKLLTKLTEEGKIDLNADNGYNTIFNEILPREQDQVKIGTQAISLFVYSDGDKLTFGQFAPMGLRKDQVEKINKRLRSLGKWAPKGTVFQLVKSQNDEWYPMPVYSTKVNQTVIDKVLAEISKLTDSTEVKEVTARLNKYVFTTWEDKPGSLKIETVKNKKGDSHLKFTIAGVEYTLDNIRQKEAIFSADLGALKQNIDFKNINTISGQNDLKENRTLTTNAYTEGGEYLVQPYVEISQLSSEQVTDAAESTTPKKAPAKTEEESIKTLTSEDFARMFSKTKVTKADLAEETDLNLDPEEPAYKRSSKLNVYKQEDRAKAKKWLDENLPGVTLSEVEDLTQLKGVLEDAFGLYRNGVIHLSKYAPQGTIYHEAGHAVFRSMLTNDEKFDLIDEAIQRYAAPKAEDLSRLQEQFKNKFPEEALTYMWYEEKIMDDYAEYQNAVDKKPFIKKLGQKITDFFNRILKFFGLFTEHDQSKITALFNKISTGRFKNASIKAKKTYTVARRDISGFESQYAASPIEGFSAQNKAHFVRAIKGKVTAKVQELYAQGKFSGTDALDITDVINKAFAEIKQSYQDKVDKAEELKLTTKEVAGALKVTLKFPEFIREVSAELKQHGIIKNDKLILTDSVADVEENTVNEINNEGNETKGEKFGDKSSIPGLKKASQRLKLFFASIPAVNESGQVKTDIYGDTIFVDFDKLYYYIERNLLGLYSWSDQLAQLNALVQTRPEVQAVINRLTQPSLEVNPEYQANLVSDFKTNFSKQQKAALMVSFDREGSGLKYRLFEANRQNLGIELYGSWEANLSNPEKNTITEFKEGKKTTFGTAKAIEINKSWAALQAKYQEELPETELNKILLTAGIEYSPEVIKKIAENPSDMFKSSLTEVLDWFASETPEAKQVKGRKAMYELVNIEVANMLTRFTSSYNNAEGETVNTIQLPSYVSKLVANLTASEDQAHKFTNTLEEFRQEEAYKYNNILTLLEKENSFREDIFTIADLSGLSQSKLDSKGAVFSKMAPKDFMNVSIALFQNTFMNKGEAKMKLPVAYYMYLTPADKKQQMVSTGLQYLVKHISGAVDSKSEIIDKFYNIVLAEASRLRNALKFKEQVQTAQGKEKEALIRNLNEYYHYKGKDNLAFNGLAYEFNYFDALNQEGRLEEITKELAQDFESDIALMMAPFKENIKQVLAEELSKEVQITLKEAVTKNLISEQNGIYSNISLEKETLGANIHDGIVNLLTSFSLNQMLHIIDMSHIMNGDIAQYKTNQIQKRTYQSGAQTTNGNFEKDTIKIKPVKDLTIKVSPHYDTYASFLKGEGFSKDQVAQRLSKLKIINSTDAQTWGSPKFFERLMREEGRWTPDVENAYKLAEGTIKGTPKQIEKAIQVMAAIKPFAFGRRFNPITKIWEFYQVKTSISWLFKNFVKDNPFLSEQRDNMTATSTELLVHESAFKAMMPSRDGLEDLNKESYSDTNTFTIRREDFGIQTENPVKGLDTENDGLRQVKMIMLGMIDVNLDYNGISGQEIRDIINTLEGINVKESADEFLKALKDKDSNKFKEFLREELLTRNPPANVSKALEIVDGEFVGALNFGPVSGTAQNMLSSILEKRVIKQAFAGGSFVQVSSLGAKGGTLKALSEEEIKKNPELEKLQSTLKHIIPNKGGQTELAEVILPAAAKAFFNGDMTLKDITSIPEELRTFITYRIPVEGPHSMLTVKVVGFLTPEQGNYILMPNEVVAQWGSDFDFDKAFFVRKHLYTDKSGKLHEVRYETSKQKLYDKLILGHKESFGDQTDKFKGTSKLVEDLLINLGVIKPIDEYTVEELNTKEARDNRILDMYLNILRSPHAFPHIISGSGFEKLTEIRDRLFGKKPKGNFFSGTSQRDLKQRNGISSKLRALSALHETGHTARTVMNSYIEVLTQAGTPDTAYSFKFNGVSNNRLDALQTSDRNLIIKELGVLLAATVDDIKDPILEDLNINDHTLHVLAAIVSSEYEYETGINLITQPAIKELTDKLSDSYTLTKEVGQKRVNIDFVMRDYTNMYDQVAKKLAVPLDFDMLTETHDLKDTDMVKWREFSENPENLKISNLTDYNDVSAHTIVDKHNLELAKYLAFQIKVLKRFDKYNQIGQGLKDLNLYLQINNSASGKFEDMLQKEYLRDKILAPDFPIKGIDFAKLHTIYEAQVSVTDFLISMEKDFPFATQLYGDIKTEFVNLQKKAGAENKDLVRIKSEDRGKINNFISSHLLMRHPFLTEISAESEKKKLLKDLPKLVSEILAPANKEYAGLRRNEFIQNLKVSYEEGNGGYGLILSRAVKLEPIAQDVLAEQFFTLYNSTAELKKGYTFKQFAEDLIKASYLASGLYTGKQSFHNLIPFEATDELGFNSFVKDINSKLNKDKLFITSIGKEVIIDQLVRNFPKFFTTVYDMKMFTPMTKEAIPTKISTHEAKVITLGRQSDFFIGTDIEGKIFPAYIRVFNTEASKALLYKQLTPGVYKLITTLGIPGKVIEVSIEHIDKSIFPKNAPDYKKSQFQALSANNEMFSNGYELNENSGEDVEEANKVLSQDDIIGQIMGFGQARALQTETKTTKEVTEEGLANAKALSKDAFESMFGKLPPIKPCD